MMTQLVQVALAEDIAEAEELQTILNQAGIASELEPAVEHHPRANRTTPAEGCSWRRLTRGCPARDQALTDLATSDAGSSGGGPRQRDAD